MAMKRCPECGEKYSDTYKYCPFCEEDALRDGEEIRRSPSRGGRRVSGGGRKPNLLTPTLVVLIFIMAGLLVYLLWGDKISAKLHGEEDSTPPVQNALPAEPDDSNAEQDGQGETPEDPDGTMPEGQDSTTQTPDDTTVPDTSSENADYEKAIALPKGLTLSTTDFSLFSVGETHTIAVSGGSGSYKWYSEDDGVASVDASGKVTAISRGDINIVVTDGKKQGTCVVRVKVDAGSGSGTTTPAPKPETPSGSGLKTGEAVVINGGNGVRVRSGPSTDYEALATIPNGGSVNIVESAGNGWYKITFSGAGGATTTGYMKGEFLSNK